MTVSEVVFEEVVEDVAELPLVLRRKVQVPCTYADVQYVGDNTKSKPHLRDVGSCRIPAEFTITLDQWKEQQV